MQRRRERRKVYQGKIHKKKNMLHVHISKELKAKLGTKVRALLVNKGDGVKVLRGDNRGKAGKVARVSVMKKKVYLEGVTVRNRRGVESLVPFDPSNLMLTEVKDSPFRKEILKGASSSSGRQQGEHRSGGPRVRPEGE
ncbi:50S ribosomal protein L24 [Candidatus Micrarchaeota archaeon]|nr:50S ribosomal protein L24 [Candidatus Micrarchaeota archaeon]